MSRDDSDAAEDVLDDDTLGEGPLGRLEDAEPGDDLDDSLAELASDNDDADDDGAQNGETEDDDPTVREIPAGVRPANDDEDDDEDDEELEADLGEILKERLASEDDDEEDEDDEIGIVTGARTSSKREDEILCEGCFLLIKPSQFDTRSPEPMCPHCGTPIAV